MQFDEDDFESIDDSPPAEWTRTDEIGIEFERYLEGETIARLTGANLPIPAEGDIVTTGQMETFEGEMTDQVDGPFVVKSRIFQYWERENYDTQSEGVVTLVTLRVVPLSHTVE